MLTMNLNENDKSLLQPSSKIKHHSVTPLEKRKISSSQFMKEPQSNKLIDSIEKPENSTELLKRK